MITRTQLINEFVFYAVKHSDTIFDGNYRIGNKLHFKLSQVYLAAKKANLLDVFTECLNHEHDGVKAWAATFSLHTSPKRATQTLKRLASSSNIFGMGAQLTLKQWENGRIDLSYISDGIPLEVSFLDLKTELTFYDVRRPIILSQIDKLEHSLNLELPVEYKAHLQKCNGGYCMPSDFNIESAETPTSCVNRFFAIYDDKFDNPFERNFDDIQMYINVYKIYAKIMPAHIIPIACDAPDNIICLSCGKDDYGYVYFWNNHEDAGDYIVRDDADYSNLYHIATNFDQLLTSLYEGDLDEISFRDVQ